MTLQAQPFGAHDYEIVLPRSKTPREVNIRALAAKPLRVGDALTIGRGGSLYDIVVEEISSQPGGRWNARCTVTNPGGQ